MDRAKLTKHINNQKNIQTYNKAESAKFARNQSPEDGQNKEKVNKHCHADSGSPPIKLKLKRSNKSEDSRKSSSGLNR